MMELLNPYKLRDENLTMDAEFECGVLFNINDGAEASLTVDPVDPAFLFLEIPVRNELLGKLDTEFATGFDPEDVDQQNAMNKWEDFHRWLGDQISLIKNNPGKSVLNVEYDDIWLRLAADCLQ